MMFRYSLNLAHEAKMVEDAVRAAFDARLRTKDMGGSTGAADAGDAIVAEPVKNSTSMHTTNPTRKLPRNRVNEDWGTPPLSMPFSY